MVNNPLILDYSKITTRMATDIFLERRMSYDGGGNLEYVGYNKTANADPDDSTWFIVKYEYTGTDPDRYRLPDNGVGFKYDWTNRATFFS